MKPVCHGLTLAVFLSLAGLVLACSVLFSFPPLQSLTRISNNPLEAKHRLAWIVPMPPNVCCSSGMHGWRRRRRRGRGRDAFLFSLMHTEVMAQPTRTMTGQAATEQHLTLSPCSSHLEKEWDGHSQSETWEVPNSIMQTLPMRPRV